MQERQSWDEWFLEEAARVATRSKDPNRKVGAIVVRPNNTEAARGYNGFARGIQDTPERYEDRDFKMAVIMHAEESAFNNCREDVTGYTLYVSPYLPCAKCASWIIAKGIKRVVTDMTESPARWEKNFAISRTILEEAGVQLDILERINDE